MVPLNLFIYLAHKINRVKLLVRLFRVHSISLRIIFFLTFQSKAKIKVSDKGVKERIVSVSGSVSAVIRVIKLFCREFAWVCFFVLPNSLQAYSSSWAYFMKYLNNYKILEIVYFGGDILGLSIISVRALHPSKQFSCPNNCLSNKLLGI